MNGKPFRVIVSSLNPVKIEAVSQALSEFILSGVVVSGAEADSGVSDQPMTDLETLTGARNRVSHIRQKFSDAGLWIGIEGGIEPRDDHFEAFAWVYAEWPSDALRTGGSGQARSTTFKLPPMVSQLITKGYELGHANDLIFGQHNTKQKGGAVGLLTHNRITRTQLYRQAVELALIPFVNPDLYKK